MNEQSERPERQEPVFHRCPRDLACQQAADPDTDAHSGQRQAYLPVAQPQLRTAS